MNNIENKEMVCALGFNNKLAYKLKKVTDRVYSDREMKIYLRFTDTKEHMDTELDMMKVICIDKGDPMEILERGDTGGEERTYYCLYM